ncbi:MAG: DUF177 domain-containing protein [Candidatus Competibacteraceae bacterium]|uniref:Large ribosomal RNA subunit accumulation protein YceD n=2 Tax=Candidatus Contendibacter odensensis TaxID=1400860 RepID=A0A7U7G8A5_9GAMM|nr:DUF177 domain-containing protein [Candidatus Competibacteraceae bacterium]CDH43375.1 conserved hypothetical protein [Candidatus Contendobacter odensis Run_B_J11]
MQTPSLPLPDKIDPWRLAAESGRLEGTLALAALPRLAAVLDHLNGAVSVSLVAGIDHQGIRSITGGLRTVIELTCQRCLEPLPWPLDVTVNLGLVRNEAAAHRLPDEYEPLLVAEGFIRVADLVEDELLLALPQIPRHVDVQECEANDYRAPSSEPAPNTEPVQPFATLASLLPSKRSH